MFFLDGACLGFEVCTQKSGKGFLIMSSSDIVLTRLSVQHAMRLLMRCSCVMCKRACATPQFH